MANRRMFSNQIIDSRRFLQMPATTRLLYYDLGMKADDDGFVESFAVLRMTGASEDDLRLLATKGYIIIVNDDLTAYIKDWTKNNQIRGDRYHKSIYHELLETVTQMATAGCTDDNQAAPKMATGGCPSIVEVSIGEYSLGKERKEKDSIPPTPQGERKPKRTPLEIPTQSETGFSNAMQEAFETWLQYKKEKKQTYQPTGLKTFIRKLKSCVEQYGENAVIDMLERAISSGYAGPVWESLKNSANPPKKETPKKKEGAWDGFWHPGMEELFPPVNGAPRN